jgi:hypothetical protein
MPTLSTTGDGVFVSTAVYAVDEGFDGGAVLGELGHG